MKKTIAFYGISVLGISVSSMLHCPNIVIEARYHFGATLITFENKDRKHVGKVIAKTFKTEKFRQVEIDKI